MVDTKNSKFDLTTSVSSPIEYYKILILQRLNDLVEAWEVYFKGKNSGIEVNTNIIHARTVSLYLSLYAYLKRKSEKFTDKIDKTLFDKEPSEQQLREIYILLNQQLDIDRLTRFDTKNTYDGTRVELENDEKGL